MALARIRRTRVDQLVEEGNKTAEVVQRSISDPDRFISACQLGITVDTLLLGALGEHIFAEDLVRALVMTGVSPSYHGALLPAATAACYVISFSLTAFLQTIFGELIPKTWTFQRAESVMMWIIWPMEFWCWITAPFIKLLNAITSLILRLVNVKEPPSHHFVHSEEELKMLVSASHEEGVIQEEEEEMLHSVFEFADTKVSEVMTPRTDMVCIGANATVKEFLATALKHGLSRLPVYEDNIDTIFGMVHIRDGLRALNESKENMKVRELVRKVLIVPENKPVGALLTEFRQTQTHMAIVIDEYGGTRGLATMEDLIEELVGEISDEYDLEQVLIQAQEDGTYVIDGKLSLEEANEELELDIEDEEFNTIGGHVFGRLGREPKAGDEVADDDWVLRVEEADKHRIIKLRLIRKTPAAAAPEKVGGSGRKTGEAAAAEKKSKSVEASPQLDR